MDGQITLGQLAGKELKMNTKEVIKRCNSFEDTFGADLSQKGHMKTKADCLHALQSHKRWLEDTVSEELRKIDDFICELGIEFADE